MKQRIKNKLRKQSVLIMDITSIPGSLDADSWLKLYEKGGIIVWDSFNKGFKPEIYPKKNLKVFTIKDTKGNETKDI